MSTTSYPAWPLPTVEPLAWFQQPEVSDAILAQLLTDLVDHNSTHMGLYATWHREAVARGMIPPYLVCIDDAYPMPVLEVNHYARGGYTGRPVVDVVLQLVDGPAAACIDYEDLVLIGAKVSA